MSLQRPSIRARLDRGRLAFDQCRRLDARLAGARLVVFAAAVIAGALAWLAGTSAWWLAAPAVAFLALAVWHDRVLRARDRAAAAIAFYEHGLARIEDRWAGLGSTGEAFHDERHPYEADLDLFGPASLFELLSLARTQAGEATLAGWLKIAADPGEVLERQEAVRELTAGPRSARAPGGDDRIGSTAGGAGTAPRLGDWHRRCSTLADGPWPPRSRRERFSPPRRFP